MRAVQFLMVFFMLAIVGFIGLEVYRNNMMEGISFILSIDPKFLMMLMVNIFVICSIGMVLLYQWVDRESRLFKARRNRYRSLLVSPDYYHSIRRMNIEQFISASTATPAQGKLDIESNLKNSSLVLLDDRHIHKNAIETHIAYCKGRLHGVFLTYFTNGNLLAEISYKNGLLDGRSIVYYANKSLHNEKYFKEGKLHGIFRAWDEEGALFFEIEYKDDVHDGFDQTYRKNGVIEYEDIYVQGVLIKRKTFDDFGQFKYTQKYKKDA